MPRAYGSLIASACVALIALTDLAQAHKPLDVPASPVNVETLSLGLGGPCVGFGWHNVNQTRVTDFGVSMGGLVVQPAHRFGRDWLAGEACQHGPGWSAEIGVQYGVHPAWDTGNEFAAAGYRVSLGGGVSLAVLGGFFYNGIDRKRKVHPITVNAFGLFPFAAVELRGAW